MRTLFSVGLVVLLSGAAVAQISEDEAKAKLEARQRARAAQRAEKVTITRGELEDQGAKIIKLEADVRSLRQELAWAKAAIPQQPATQPLGDAIARAVADHKIIEGMTIAQAWSAIPYHPWFRDETRTDVGDGVQIVVWRWAFSGSLGVKPYQRLLTLRLRDGHVVKYNDLLREK